MRAEKKNENKIRKFNYHFVNILTVNASSENTCNSIQDSCLFIFFSILYKIRKDKMRKKKYIIDVKDAMKKMWRN